MKKFIKYLLISFIFLALSSQQLFAKSEPLVLAFFPYVNPSKILIHNKGMRQFLETELNRPVTIVMAKNSKTYVENMKKNSYDLLFSPPHLGRYSELKYGYKNIVMTANNIQGYYIVRKNSKLKTLSDLKGKKIAMASPLTIVHQIAVDDFKKLGLVNGENMTISVIKNHMNSIFSVLKGFNDAALTGVKLWKRLPQKYKKDLRLLAKSSKTSGFFIMGNSRLDDSLIQKIQTSLLKFHTSTDGKNYLFKGFKKIDKKTSQSMDKYISVFE